MERNRKFNQQAQSSKRIYLLIILVIVALLCSFFFFFQRTSHPYEQTSQMDFSLLSERVADYSAAPILFSFQPISLDIIIDILRDKQPGAPNLEQRIDKILKELVDEEEEETETTEPESEEIPTSEPSPEGYPINNIDSGSRGFCGDGNRDNGEQCDDGNTIGGDGCSVTCILEICGNNVVDTGEQCDPPNGITCDGSCQNIPIVCGNSIIQPGEQCDPPNGTTCDASCQNIPIVCGNSIIQPGEQCDPPNGTTCDAYCQIIPTVCGNNITEPGEECDDGNTTGGDGCSAICALEVCGNNVLDIGEECDDGNTIDGDGCSATCTLEDPILCTEVSYVSFTQRRKWIRWEIFNSTGQDIVIEEINIYWPVEMERLNKIELDGDKIWNGSDTLPPTLISSGWAGDATDRTIEIGNTEILGFKFDGDDSSFGYDVTVTFPDPSVYCYINDVH